MIMKEKQKPKTNEAIQVMKTLHNEPSKSGNLTEKKPESGSDVNVVVKNSGQTEVENRKISEENFFENVKSLDELDREIEEATKLIELRTNKLKISVVEQFEQKSTSQLQHSSLDDVQKDGKLSLQVQPNKEPDLVSSKRPQNRRRKKKIQEKNQHQSDEPIVQSVNSYKQIDPKLGVSNPKKPDARSEKKTISLQPSVCKIANDDDTPVFLKAILRNEEKEEKTQLESAIYVNKNKEAKKEKEKLNNSQKSRNFNCRQKLPSHSIVENGGKNCEASKEFSSPNQQSKPIQYGPPQVTPF